MSSAGPESETQAAIRGDSAASASQDATLAASASPQITESRTRSTRSSTASNRNLNFTPEDDAYLVDYLSSIFELKSPDGLPEYRDGTLNRTVTITGAMAYERLTENTLLYPWAARHNAHAWKYRFSSQTDLQDKVRTNLLAVYNGDGVAEFTPLPLPSSVKKGAESKSSTASSSKKQAAESPLELIRPEDHGAAEIAYSSQLLPTFPTTSASTPNTNSTEPEASLFFTPDLTQYPTPVEQPLPPAEPTWPLTTTNNIGPSVKGRPSSVSTIKRPKSLSTDPPFSQEDDWHLAEFIGKSFALKRDARGRAILRYVGEGQPERNSAVVITGSWVFEYLCAPENEHLYPWAKRHRWGAWHKHSSLTVIKERYMKIINDKLAADPDAEFQQPEAASGLAERRVLTRTMAKHDPPTQQHKPIASSSSSHLSNHHLQLQDESLSSYFQPEQQPMMDMAVEDWNLSGYSNHHDHDGSSTFDSLPPKKRGRNSFDGFNPGDNSGYPSSENQKRSRTSNDYDQNQNALSSESFLAIRYDDETDLPPVTEADHGEAANLLRFANAIWSEPGSGQREQAGAIPFPNPGPY